MVSIKRTSTEAGHADEQGGQGVAGAADDFAGLDGLDLDMDDLDANFGSLDELAESLEILEEEGQHHSIGSDEMETSTAAAAAANCSRRSLSRAAACISCQRHPSCGHSASPHNVRLVP